MPVVDVIFEKLEANHRDSEQKTTDFKVNSNSTIKKIERKEVSGVGESIVVHFEFTTTYVPDAGDIRIGGRIIYMAIKPSDIVKEEKGKMTFKDVNALQEVQNVILRASTLQALWLAKEARLPMPIQLPSVVFDQEKKEDGKKGYA